MALNIRDLEGLKVVRAIVEMGLEHGRAVEGLGLSVRPVTR